MSESTGWSANEALDLPAWVPNSSQRRRLKAVLVLGVVWALVAVLHLIPVTRWAVTGVATLVALHASRMTAVPMQPLPEPLDLPEEGAGIPRVSILVPAKNESVVLPDLLMGLGKLEYPAELLDIWVIDDASTDATPQILERYQTLMPSLHIHRRAEGSGGGKSGALNEVLPLTQGELILVCDADAGIPADMLRRMVPLFEVRASGDLSHPRRRVAAVQVRKAVSNAQHSWLTRLQAAELTWDSCLQQGKVALGGLGELRGNGQMVRRDVLLRCGRWNEETVTDDLDLTLRLHLAGVDIFCTPLLAIEEEAVTSWTGLWRQRSRWAEGGYQRVLDYWPGILSNQMGWSKTWDLGVFFLVQYLMPMALVPDLIWTLAYSHQPALWPIGMVFGLISVLGFWTSLRRIPKLRGWILWRDTLLASAYMLHWIPVMVVTTGRMCVQPKRLRWVKTVHQGRGV